MERLKVQVNENNHHKGHKHKKNSETTPNEQAQVERP